MFNSDNVAFEVDVWETIEGKLKTVIKNALRVSYSSNGGIPDITVTYIPYVDDASTLNQTKSRMNVLTVD